MVANRDRRHIQRWTFLWSGEKIKCLRTSRLMTSCQSKSRGWLAAPQTTISLVARELVPNRPCSAKVLSLNNTMLTYSSWSQSQTPIACKEKISGPFTTIKEIVPWVKAPKRELHDSYQSTRWESIRTTISGGPNLIVCSIKEVSGERTTQPYSLLWKITAQSLRVVYLSTNKMMPSSGALSLKSLTN